MEIKEENIIWPFSIVNSDGTLFRSSLVFSNAAEFRNTSATEREAMQQERYNAHWEYLRNLPAEEIPSEEE